MFFSPPQPSDLVTESDVEQKFTFPLLTSQPPHGLGFPDAEIFTKPNIREFQIVNIRPTRSLPREASWTAAVICRFRMARHVRKRQMTAAVQDASRRSPPDSAGVPNLYSRIGKGASAKLYYPDYLVTILGLPILIVEAKKPGEDLVAAAGEARLYATELNACYPPGLNPVKFCIVTDGLNTQLRTWDSDNILAQFPLDQVGPAHPAFGQFTRLLALDALRAHAASVHAASKPSTFFRALDLVGGQTVQNEQIAFNDFGRVSRC